MRPVCPTTHKSTALKMLCPVCPTIAWWTQTRHLMKWPRQVLGYLKSAVLFFFSCFLFWKFQLCSFKSALPPYSLWKGCWLVHVDICVLGKHAAWNWRDSHHAPGSVLSGWLLQRRKHSLLFGSVAFYGLSSLLVLCHLTHFSVSISGAFATLLFILL